MSHIGRKYCPHFTYDRYIDDVKLRDIDYFLSCDPLDFWDGNIEKEELEKPDIYQEIIKELVYPDVKYIYDGFKENYDKIYETPADKRNLINILRQLKEGKIHREIELLNKSVDVDPDIPSLAGPINKYINIVRCPKINVVINPGRGADAPNRVYPKGAKIKVPRSAQVMWMKEIYDKERLSKYCATKGKENGWGTKKDNSFNTIGREAWDAKAQKNFRNEARSGTNFECNLQAAPTPTCLYNKIPIKRAASDKRGYRRFINVKGSEVCEKSESDFIANAGDRAIANEFKTMALKYKNDIDKRDTTKSYKKDGTPTYKNRTGASTGVGPQGAWLAGIQAGNKNHTNQTVSINNRRFDGATDGSQDNEYVSNPIVENYVGGGSDNYNYIINPKNGKKTKINTAAGKLILQNYFNKLF